MTAKEAAALIGRHVSHIYQWIDAGRLATRVRADGVTVVPQGRSCGSNRGSRAAVRAGQWDVGEMWDDQQMSDADAPPNPEAEGRGFKRPGTRIFRFPPSTPPVPKLDLGIATATADLLRSVEGLKALPPPDLLGPASRSAEAAERTADTIAEMASQTDTIVRLTQQSLAASESARLDAARSERSAKCISVISTIISAASLVTAVVAIIVTLS
ncbi:hypothetical protein GCM10010458_36770 [Microbacterium luteolum]|uniref:Helix-turn-helix domain-containing protein n=1 Tax=Microbacterium luteolum TaxID=69367 RepID=A0ABY7XK99_MICLT|nr:helix-turn-helix domain-containing protein [Microbacterium luteolum]WDM42540.1 helix-turn-helix domain-containing protein [Microbacterium luteolum]